MIDTKPRPEGLSEAQASAMRLLADQVMSLMELRRAVVARDKLRAAEAQAFRAREAFRDTQAAIVAAGDDLQTVLRSMARCRRCRPPMVVWSSCWMGTSSSTAPRAAA